MTGPRKRILARFAAGVFLVSLAAALPVGRTSTSPARDVTCDPPVTGDAVRFAVIGDYGMGNDAETAVSTLVHGWSPDLILTVGDNNYPKGELATLDTNIGKDYHDYICPYIGAYPSGSSVNRFFPTPGNHDWDSTVAPGGTGLDPYLGYFELPGNERYYDFTWGPAHFFMLDSDSREPDGNAYDSTQGQWLQSALGTSVSPWNLVLMHHAPYSSGYHRSTTIMQWPYREWGADAVLAGHDHSYERIVKNRLPFFVNGLGGAGIRGFISPYVEGSEIRYSDDWGTMLVDASTSHITFKFMDKNQNLIDTFGMSLSGMAPADFGGDGTSDVVIYRGGSWRRYDFATAAYVGSNWTGNPGGSCIPAPMDYDGDGAREFTQLCGGAWHFYNPDGSYNKGIWVGNVAGQLPVPADYNGDGTEDVMLFRRGAWLAYDFTTGASVPSSSVWTGLPGGSGLPAPMDYDGDGKVDRTVFSNNGAWHFYNANGSYNKGIWVGKIAGQLPVPGDYNGDGVDEPVAFRGGGWRFYDFAAAAFQSNVWTGVPASTGGGLPGPAPIDYDGDGKLDFGYYSGATWHFYDSDGSYNKGVPTGPVPGDMPISRRPLP